MAESTVTKICFLCDTEKPLTDFYRKTKTGRLARQCKECARKESKEIYALTHPNRRRSPWRNCVFIFLVPYKRCSKCCTFKGGDKFCSNKKNKDGLSDWCKDCHRERNKRPDLIEKRKGRKRTGIRARRKQGRISGRGTPQRVECPCGVIIWRRSDYRKFKGLCRRCLQPPNPQSATAIRRREYGRSQYRRWRKAVLERDGYICQGCGSMKNLEADHILPWSTHPEIRYEVSNGRTLCRPCHLKTDTYGSGALKYRQTLKITFHTTDGDHRAQKLRPLPPQLLPFQ